MAAARRLRDELGITRPILVDDLDGTVHTTYGRMPNMAWVIGRGGTILYKAEWTSAERIGDFLERRQTQRAGGAQAPFHTEQPRVACCRPRHLLARPATQRPPRGHRVRARRGGLGRAGTEVMIP
jgi:hypothetical protein